MKAIKLLLTLVMISLTSSVLAQSKGEMPFSSSSANANNLIRNAWAALSDAKREEANNYLRQVLSEDANCGIAYASLTGENPEERTANLRKAAELKLSADEKMLVDGVLAGRDKKPNAEFFERLIKKYPRDYYLHLWVMFTHTDKDRAIAIGENIAKRNPKFSPVYNFLGYLYMDKNEMAKAEGNFDKYISLRPELANVYDSKGDYMMRAGKTEEAIELYEKASSLGMAPSKVKAERARAQLKFPRPSDSDAAAIKEIINAAFEGARKSDVDELLKHYAEQSIDMLGNQRVHVGLANIRKRFSTMFLEGSFINLNFTLEHVNGTGPIAVAYTKNEFVWKDFASENETPRKNNSIYLLRKNPDREWKILANHYYGWNEDAPPLSADDRASINKVLAAWDDAIKPGEILSAKNFDAFSAQYSQQAIEIFSNQISNIGLANLRARWEGFTGARMETNSLGMLGVEGFGRRAVAWGIGNQSFYPKDSRELQKFQFPWAMILTKENDDAWRILTIHWGAE